MVETDKELISAKISALEKPVARFSFERWKSTIIGTFIGVLTGSAFSFIVPKETIKNNKFLNSWLQPDKMTANIYPSSVAGLFGWVGALSGTLVDIVKDFKKPNTVEYLQQLKELEKQGAASPADDFIPDKNSTTMQDKVASKRQETVNRAEARYF